MAFINRDITEKRIKAEKRGLEFRLTQANLDLIYNAKYCFYTGVKFYPNKGDDYRLSLERIDSSRGYVPGNVIPVTVKANELKSNFSLVELKKEVDRRNMKRLNLQKNLSGLRKSPSSMAQAIEMAEYIGRMYKNIYILEQIINTLETKDLHREARRYMTWFQKIKEFGS